MEENKIPINVCCVCRNPIYDTWFHAQGMRCGNPECELKFIKMFVKKDD